MDEMQPDPQPVNPPFVSDGDGRDDKGRFIAGNKGGPGNPGIGQLAKYRARFASSLKESDIDAALVVIREVMAAGKTQTALRPQNSCSIECWAYQSPATYPNAWSALNSSSQTANRRLPMSEATKTRLAKIEAAVAQQGIRPWGPRQQQALKRLMADTQPFDLACQLADRMADIQREATHE